MKNANSEAIKIFCSRLCAGEGVKPLEPSEWSAVAGKLNEIQKQPSDMLEFSAEDFRAQLQADGEFAERMLRLIDRSASLAFELARYENEGIGVVTRADKEYPRKLKAALGNSCPPLFYYAGDVALLRDDTAGFAGSRDSDEGDERFAREAVKKVVERGYGVTSGGARGIDSVSEEAAVLNGGFAIEYLADSMRRRLRTPSVLRAVQDGNLLLMSHVKPDAGFSTGSAMTRNRYIYAQSCGAVVVKCDYNKGGTWAGATENLRHGWCTQFCRRNDNIRGNRELIARGAIPIDENWDGDVLRGKPVSSSQISLFD